MSTKIGILDVFLSLAALFALVFGIVQIADDASRFFSSGPLLWLVVSILTSSGVLLVFRADRR